jgi:hypothetical protein
MPCTAAHVSTRDGTAHQTKEMAGTRYSSIYAPETDYLVYAVLAVHSCGEVLRKLFSGSGKLLVKVKKFHGRPWYIEIVTRL